MPITKVVTPDARFKTNWVNPAYVVYVSTDCEGDIRDLPGFKETISYANGQLVKHAQVGLYRFPNPEGLQPVGSNGWLATNSSGPELVSLSEDTAFGIIQSGALEESNIDLTAELVAMISAQRVYQANSQTIKTQDSIFQTITNLR